VEFILRVCDQPTKTVFFTAGNILSAVVHNRAGCRRNNWASSTHWLRGIFVVALICMYSYSCADNTSDRQTDRQTLDCYSDLQPASASRNIDWLAEELRCTPDGRNSVPAVSRSRLPTLVSHMRTALDDFLPVFRACYKGAMLLRQLVSPASCMVRFDAWRQASAFAVACLCEM